MVPTLQRGNPSRVAPAARGQGLGAGAREGPGPGSIRGRGRAPRPQRGRRYGLMQMFRISMKRAASYFMTQWFS